MSKTAYISIEGADVQVYISTGKTLNEENFYKFELKDLPEFVRNKGVKELIISQFLPNLITFRFNLPFAYKNLKKKKILDGIVMGEIRKRYPALHNFSFIYKLYEGAAGAYVRCYLLDEANFDTVNKLIIEGLNVKAFYPNFLPLIELLKVREELVKHDQIICLFSGKLRYIFVLHGEELILQRSFESSVESLGDEDVININMTVSYSIQNLRIKPEKVIFIGERQQEIEGLTISYDFLEIPENINALTIPFCLFKFQSQLKGKEFFLPEYKKYLSTSKYINYGIGSLLLASILFLFYNLYILNEINGQWRILNFYRNEMALKERDFLVLQEQINYFEKNLSPFINLQNRKNSEGDIRGSIYPISEASKIKEVQINSIDIENKVPQKIKITGNIAGYSFTERQKAYLDFKNTLVEKGFKISNEKWDITNGDFTLEGEYEARRTLP